MTWRDCPHAPIRCSLDEEITREFENGKEGICGASAAAKVAQEDPEGYAQFVKETEEHGYRVFRIEDSIRYLEENSQKVISADNKRQSDLKKMFGSYRFLPFDLRGKKMRDEEEVHIYGSEFSAKCPDQIFYYILDKDKTGIDPMSDAARKGIAGHRVVMDETGHGTNSMLPEGARDTRFNLPNPAFTERRVEYVLDTSELELEIRQDKPLPEYDTKLPDKLIMRGKADAVFRLESEGKVLDDWLVIWDNKSYEHRAYEKKSTKLQLLAYGLAIDQKLGLGTDNFLLISQQKPGDKHPGSDRKPSFFITYANREDGILDELHSEMARHYLIKRMLTDDPRLAQRVGHHMRKKNKNGETACSRLYSTMPCAHHKEGGSGYCLKMLDILKERSPMDVMMDNAGFKQSGPV